MEPSTNAIDQYLDFLWEHFIYDMGVFSQSWMYYWLLIPAVGYLVFFFLKWVILTTPFWLPLSIVAGACRGGGNRGK